MYAWIFYQEVSKLGQNNKQVFCVKWCKAEIGLRFVGSEFRVQRNWKHERRNKTFLGENFLSQKAFTNTQTHVDEEGTQFCLKESFYDFKD